MIMGYKVKLTAALACLFLVRALAGGSLVITGVIDGPLTNGLPKAIEVYATDNIADLSIYGLGSANNGGGTNGQEFGFPAVSATAGDFIYIASESTGFAAFFGFSPDYTSGAVEINGDDAIELFRNGIVVDVFGDISQDGTGKPWEHLDGWVYRVDDTGPDGTVFVLSNWFFSGVNALDGETANATATTPFPIGTFNFNSVDNPPTVFSLDPADNATGIAVGSDLTVTFTEPVQVGSGAITLHSGTDNSVVESLQVGSASITVSGNSLAINPSLDLAEGSPYYVQIPAGTVLDLSGNPFGGLTGATAWNFTTATGTVPPTDFIAYYTGIGGLTGSALRTALHNLIDNHTVISYGDLDELMKVIDEAEDNPTYVRLLYSQAGLPKTPRSWNIEHVWPRSRGVGESGPDNSDVHHLFPCESGVNSKRGNYPFDYTSGSFDFDPFAPESTVDVSASTWEPFDRDKGLVARAVLYMAVRYDGSDSATTNLVLDDGPLGTNEMGMLTTLLEWNRLFPPSDYERARNDAIHEGVDVGGGVIRGQGNRNPFIDFPQFADAVFLPASQTSYEKWAVETFSLAQLADPAVWGPDADINGDGQPNYFHFLTNTQPIGAGNDPLDLLVDGPGGFILRFYQPVSDTVTEQLQLQSSTSLLPASWSTVPNWENSATISPAGTYQEFEYSTAAPAAGTSRFWRVSWE